MSTSYTTSRLRWAICLLALVGLGATTADADPVADFYKGKTIELHIGFSSGGGYDVYGRIVARHMGRHVPGNPQIVPKNTPGAGSLRAANWLYAAAPKDGTAIATVSRGAAFDPLLGVTAAQYDGNKFNWIGSANDEVSVCVSWKDSGVATFEDMKTKELVVGGTGPTADTDQFPKVINGILGTKMKIIPGYPGGNDVSMALERGEVKGRCAWSWSSVTATRPNWIKDKTVNVLVQLAMHKHADLPDVPLIIDLARTDDEREMLSLVFARQTMGRPFTAPPGVPSERVTALRKAFMDTMKDKEFLAEAEKSQLEITPVSGEELQALVAKVYAGNPAIAKKVAELLK